MVKIYVVRGSAGEYSDRTEWLVAAFMSPEKAAQRVLDATRRANDLFSENWLYLKSGANEFDPYMQFGDGDARYDIQEVDLIE